jgi:putative autotransporter adhesin-like protein
MLNHSAPAARPRMRRWIRPFVTMGVVAAISACSSITGSAVTGSGTLRTELRDVGGFSIIELTGSGDVVIEQNGTESLSVEAEDNLLPDLTSDVRGGTLRLGTWEGVDLQPTLPVTYHVTVKDLTGLHLSGSGSVTAAGITTPAIAIDLSGSGDITVAGSADHQTVSVSGSGDYSAGDLATLTSAAEVSGSGDISLDVRDVLQADISGSGDVIYTGSPRITQDVSGSGELLSRE